MTKSEKKAELKGMIARFFATNDVTMLTQLRDDIFSAIGRLPMSTGDRNVMEEAMDLWSYNSDRYIKNTRSIPAKTSITSDFDAVLKTIDTSLLSN